MEGIDWATLMRVFGSDLDELVKMCQWKGENCLDNDLWTVQVTRIGECWELDVPKREVALSTESLRLVLG